MDENKRIRNNCMMHHIDIDLWYDIKEEKALFLNFSNESWWNSRKMHQYVMSEK